MNNELTIIPGLDTRSILNIKSDAAGYPAIAPFERQQPNPTRYGWPREQCKPRKTANRIGRLAVCIVFGGGLGYLFITQLLG